ncbi:MAG: VIT family protein [Hyphomonadaceae bacterium]|nr:VIT family protein [Hyphomonadaceae bacterium]
MARLKVHRERHVVQRIGWLRAAVLGANDGIVSTASLIVGVAAAQASKENIVIAGVATLVAGAMSMAAGEYVSVSSQADAEAADLRREAQELKDDPGFEREELTQIYVARGLSPALGREVAEQLMAKDALKAHARDELDITETNAARPLLAAGASAASFASGAILPLAVVLIAPLASLGWSVSIASLVFLALLGVLGARAGGADTTKGVVRVLFWGAVAMAITAAIGRLFGTAA